MHWNQLRGRWKQWKGKAKEKWGRFTGNDLLMIAGRREQIVGLLQERFGYPTNEIDLPHDEFAREVDL